MDKLSLHESLRIYLPGLLITGLAYYAFFLSVVDFQSILLPAAFAGILFDAATQNFHVRFFEKIVDRQQYPLFGKKLNYTDACREIIKVKIQNSKLEEYKDIVPSELSDSCIGFVLSTFFVRRYESPELNYFRSSKSFGIMCFNFGAACFIALWLNLTIIIYNISISDLLYKELVTRVIMSAALICSGTLLIKRSESFFIHSVQRELKFWQAIKLEEVSEIIEMINFWDSVHR
jgi:hypothetical protein